MKIEADCACIPAGYKINDVEKQRFEVELAKLADLLNLEKKLNSPRQHKII